MHDDYDDRHDPIPTPKDPSTLTVEQVAWNHLEQVRQEYQVSDNVNAAVTHDPAVNVTAPPAAVTPVAEAVAKVAAEAGGAPETGPFAYLLVVDGVAVPALTNDGIDKVIEKWLKARNHGENNGLLILDSGAWIAKHVTGVGYDTAPEDVVGEDILDDADDEGDEDDEEEAPKKGFKRS